MLKPVKRPKSPCWIARGTIDGQRIEKSTGICKSQSKSEAKRACRSIELEVLLASDSVKKEPYLFGDAVVDYLEQGGSPRYMGNLVDYFGDTACDEITNQSLNRAALTLYPNAAGATINRQLLTPVGAVINLASMSRLCLPLRVKRRREGEPREHFMLPEEADKLIAATHQSFNKHMPALVTFLIGQGCRVGEALKLQANDLHLEGGFAILRAETTKGKYERRITLIPRVRAALSTLNTINSEGALFRTQHGKEYTFNGIRGGQIESAFRTAVVNAGLDPNLIHPHICRHTWATWFYAQLKDPLRLKREGGWKKDTWERYTKTQGPGLGDDALEYGWDFDQQWGKRGGILDKRMKKAAKT